MQVEMRNKAYVVAEPLCVSDGEFPYLTKKPKTYEQACAVAVFVKLADEAWNYTHPTEYCEMQHAVLADAAAFGRYVKLLDNPMIPAAKMYRLGILSRYVKDVTPYLSDDFTPEQLDVIIYGLEMGVDSTSHVKAGVDLSLLWNVLFLLRHQPGLRRVFAECEVLDTIPGMRGLVGEYNSVDGVHWSMSPACK